MVHKKRRVIQSIMEEESLTIVSKKLPKEWVIHQYAPDYGIDFVVRLFQSMCKLLKTDIRYVDSYMRQGRFSGFASCLYYSSNSEHVNKADTNRPHF